MSPERSVPVLPVDDLEAARRFYVDALRFDVAFEATADGHTGLLGLRRGSIEITLDCPMAGHGRHACVSLRVDSADRYYDEWRHRAPLRRPPNDEDWGGRTFDFQDPFGNTIFVIGPPAGSHGGARAGQPGARPARLVSPRYVLAVPELARSAAYYRDVLGFAVHEIGDPGWRWFARDGCVILAGECPDAIAPGALGDHSYFAYVDVDGIDALHAEYADRGVELIKPLRDEPWGMREFGIRTLDGHRMMFGSRIDAGQPGAPADSAASGPLGGSGRAAVAVPGGRMAAPSTLPEVLGAYVEAFATQRAEEVVPFYELPCTFIRPDGTWVVQDEATALALVTHLLDHARSQGHRRTEVSEVTTRELAPNLAELSGVFIRYGGGDAEIARFGFTYLFRRGPEAWRIILAVAHDPVAGS